MSEVEHSSAAFGAVWLAILIDILGFGLILPLFPYIVKIVDTAPFPTEDAAYGWIIAIYSIVQFIMSPIWGRLSDSVGRRPVLLIGILGTSLSFLMLAFAKSLLIILISRGIQGFFTAASLPTARAYVADTTPVEERAKKFGFLGAAFGLGFAFGPMFGGFLAKITIGNLYLYAIPSIVAAGMSIVNFIMAYVNIKESLPVELRGVHSGEFRDNFKQLIRFSSYPGVPLLILVFGLFNLSFSGFETLFSMYLLDIDPTLQPDNIGLIFAYIGTISIIIQGGLIGPITKRFGDDGTTLMSLVILALGFASYVFITDLMSVYLLTIPIAIGASLFSPAMNSSLSKRIPLSEQGGGLGINSSLGSLGRILGPLLYTAPFYYRFGGDTQPFITSAYFFAFIAILIYFVIHRGPITASTVEETME